MIHLIKNPEEWEVWTDCTDNEKDGRCLYSHTNKLVALAFARAELQEDLAQIDVLIKDVIKENQS